MAAPGDRADARRAAVVSATGRTADATQAAAILRQFTDGASLDEVLERGRGRLGLSRVLDVLRENNITLDEHGRIPTPARRPAARGTSAVREVDRLLAAAAGHDDPRIAGLASHIRADLGVLRALLQADRERADAAHRMVAADVRADRLLREHAATHPQRRSADGRPTS